MTRESVKESEKVNNAGFNRCINTTRTKESERVGNREKIKERVRDKGRGEKKERDKDRNEH